MLCISAVLPTLSKSRRFSKLKGLFMKLHNSQRKKPTAQSTKARKKKFLKGISSYLNDKSFLRLKKFRVVSTPRELTRPSWSQFFSELRKSTSKMQLTSTIFLSESSRLSWPKWNKIKTTWSTKFLIKKKQKGIKSQSGLSTNLHSSAKNSV